MNREIFLRLAKRQAQGLMFHSDMADYYMFLNLKSLNNFHNCRFFEEGKTYRKIKNYFICWYHKTLVIDNLEPITPVTPNDWQNKTSMDVNKESIKLLTKNSLTIYLNWETETERIYKDCAEELFKKGYFEDYSFVNELIDEVYLEKKHIEDLMLDLQMVDYDINEIKNISYKLNK